MSRQQQCMYCQNKNKKCLVKCECGNYFCNCKLYSDIKSSFSHIIYHMQKSGHKQLILTGSQTYNTENFIECILCKKKIIA